MTGQWPVTAARGPGGLRLSPVAAAAGPDTLAGHAWLVETFVRRTPGVTHAVVTTADGLVLAASPHHPSDVSDRLAAIAAGLVSIARAATQTVGGDVLQTTVDLDTGLLLVRPLPERASGTVLVLTRPDADAGDVGYQLTLLTRPDPPRPRRHVGHHRQQRRRHPRRGHAAAMTPRGRSSAPVVRGRWSFVGS